MKLHRFIQQIHDRGVFPLGIGRLTIPAGSTAAHDSAGLGYGSQLLLDEPVGRLLALDWL
jgi:hypothetical protein